MTFRAQMLDDMKPEGVVVWDTSEDTEASLWGGVMTATAKSKKIRGAVIAGGIRDTKQILEQDFPVFYKYRTSNGSLGRQELKPPVLSPRRMMLQEIALGGVPIPNDANGMAISAIAERLPPTTAALALAFHALSLSVSAL